MQFEKEFAASVVRHWDVSGGTPVGRMSWTPCKKDNEEQEWAQGQLKEGVYLKDCLHF